MLFPDAQHLWGQFLAPLTVSEFLDNTLLGGFQKLPTTVTASATRTGLLGPDPRATLLDAVHLAPKLTYHSANPSGPPPPPRTIADATDHRQWIDEFHARHYSIRFPELRPLSPPLDRLARALEILLHQPVTTSAFWSCGGMQSPVHHDDHDLIVVQLHGTKRWYLSNKPAELGNPWRGIPDEPPVLGPHTTAEVRPGDVLYLPRGTLHSVDSATESLHLAIGFTPLTVRGALMAALDHLSDLDRALRVTLGTRLAFQLREGCDPLTPPVLDGVARLLAACRTPGFLAGALQRNSARTVPSLNALPTPPHPPEVDLDTALIQADTAFCHLTASPTKIDFSYPGGHVYIHRGVQESVLYMADTPRFKVRDIPGDIADDVRLSLATKLLEVGFLAVAPSTAAAPPDTTPL